ncbi:PEPxxWA-CTERM sorting domain-containing protein [Roseateles sp.]|uniref:PEPxxWA-CTERM sorting domain-containing protein n=1 Tax=Roseateles sp. TaxID=1971397 RepID=UPI003264C028
MKKIVQHTMLAAAAALLSLSAWAVPATYGDSGGSGQAPITVSFVAIADGPVTGYYTGWSGGFTALVGLSINGVDGPIGLSNHGSAYGESLVLGNALAGDKLVFFLDVAAAPARYYSDASLNHDGVNGANVNHVWVSSYAGDATLPGGLLIAFEDLPGTGADFNYQDHGLVLANVTAVPVPEPASWALMLGGFAGLAGLSALRRRR